MTNPSILDQIQNLPLGTAVELRGFARNGNPATFRGIVIDSYGTKTIRISTRGFLTKDDRVATSARTLADIFEIETL